MEQAMVLALEQAADQTYAAFEAKMEGETGEIKAYIDEKTALAQDDANAYTDEKTALAQAAAKAYTDEKAALAQEDAKAYTDEKTALAEDDAKAYTDEKTALAESNANAYTDEKTAPASVWTLGTVYLGNMESQETGLYLADGKLQLMPASRGTIDKRTGRAPICPITLEYAVKSVGDGYYAKVEDVGGENWRLIRDDTLTEAVSAYKVTTDSEGAAFALKKVMIEVYADTTEGVYPSSGNLLFNLCQYNNDAYWAKTLWATAPFPATDGKSTFVRLDAEVIGKNAYTTISTQKNVDGFNYTQLGAATNVSRSQAFPLNRDNIAMLRFSYTGTGGMHIGTRIVVWGVDA